MVELKIKKPRKNKKTYTFHVSESFPQPKMVICFKEQKTISKLGSEKVEDPSSFYFLGIHLKNETRENKACSHSLSTSMLLVHSE